MKLYKLSILALALAGTMAACSDDDYTAPAATPGAFFPVESPDLVELPFDGNSVEIPVRRNTPNIPSDETFKLTVDDPSGLFTIPTSVTFTGHEVIAQLPVTFDPAKIETDKEYPVTITIDGMANKWGLTTYSFVLDRKTPYDVTNLGKGVYEYTQYLEGLGENEVIKSVNPLEPNIEIYTLKGWFDYPTEKEGIDLVLKVHKDILMPNGYPYVELPWTKLKFVNTNYAAIKVISYFDFVMWRYDVDMDFCAQRNFYLESTTGEVILSPDMLSYFDTDKGVFNLCNFYGAFDDSDSYLGGWGPGYEYFYLPGYPDYEIELNYLGYFTNAEDEITAMGELYTGADVETVDVYNVAGDDVQAAVESILNGEIEGETITPESSDEAISVKFTVPGAGTYTMIAIANGEGEPQGVSYATYTIAGAGVVDKGNWESIGEGIYVDGWVTPRFSMNNVQLNPFQYSYKVEVEKNLDAEGQYRMVSPYTSENCPLLGNNENKKATNITFDISDPDFPTVAFQSSGFTFSDGALWISDYNWFLLNCAGYESKEEVLASSKVDQASLSYYEDGVVEVPLPLFAVGDDKKMSSNVDDLGYNWKGPNGKPYPSQLTMPAASKGATAAKAIRHAVSSDRFMPTAKAMNNVDKVRKGSKRNQPVALKRVMMTPANSAQLR